MADPVAEKSGFLKMYMSSHPDTLVGYAKWYGKVAETITSAEMSAIDTKSMTLTCTLKGGAKKVVSVAFEPPLAGYEAVKPRLLEMKAHAQEGLGMIKAPQITTFNFPAFECFKSSMIVGAVCYFHWFPRASKSPLFIPGHYAHSLVGGTVFKFIFYAIFTAHVVESLYTFSLCRKHKTGFVVGALYVASTFVFGIPMIFDLRKRIQDARINSVMKVE